MEYKPNQTCKHACDRKLISGTRSTTSTATFSNAVFPPALARPGPISTVHKLLEIRTVHFAENSLHMYIFAPL